MNKSKNSILISGLALLIWHSASRAEDGVYWLPSGFPPAFKSPKQGCDYIYSAQGGLVGLADRYRPANNKLIESTYKCALADVFGNWTGDYFGIIIQRQETCTGDLLFDYATNQCSNTVQKGRPDDQQSCDIPSIQKGNPVNFATGNKYQQEEDIKIGTYNPIIISRYYNSVDERWRHSYSAHLDINDDWISLVGNDGKEFKFSKENGEYYSKTLSRKLTNTNNVWTYTSQQDETLTFDKLGRLVQIKLRGKGIQKISYHNNTLEIQNDSGGQVLLTEDFLHQPMHVSGKHFDVSYVYSGGVLTTAIKNLFGEKTTRLYHYEDTRVAGFRPLTGITDERGIRYATWEYNLSKKVISSQHSAGTQKITFTYDSDNSTSVTNELNKKSVYQFQLVHGLKRVVKIEGEPTPDCPASNSSYTYNEAGQLSSRTDAKGNITTYDYNDRGLITNRSEAVGTSTTRTTKTEWHPYYSLPTRIIGPEKTALYIYDDEGNETSRIENATYQ
ncbi:RHS repeat domain-containing protein [Pseudomonas alliivorans]|uniref:RHS repeat domain-containing protein n=1 Tax=Pseudomonas alliivorans TaxID=2810613 RepID=UPI001AE10F6B|nr:RHS repeat domain-containing protein [Pseudomonas alliivorans]MBP0941855.1 RHS repeat protein [Pseudomonas alliivorans]MEE4671601.1 RHS repeat domain-containing protein [Pseudomonas alliivorans]MEE4878959.1 RHS repeat domain-containing protein [Pseudomonas alliivorans]MEE4931198.1 RHS repeat domain-containing protein [Pseudomonas alliivorans]MEE4937156.1 RHS repeat domain-containing protein [Pseudomonas alliivorans]